MRVRKQMPGWHQRLVGALVVLAAGCAAAEGDDAQPAADSARAPVTRVINVEADTVRPGTFTNYIRITGEAEAFLDVTLSAEESGAVAAFPVRKGQLVDSGAVIARLDATVLAAQVAEARASAGLAREQYERQRRLWEDEQIGSEIAYLQARYQAEIAEARLATLESRLAKTTIRAPVSGYFDEQFLEIGELVMPGTPVARIVVVDRIKITGGVPERFASSVGRRDVARITFDIFPDREFEGAISFVGSSVDGRSRTFPIEVVVANPGGVVKPRMVANVELVRDALSDVITVPQQVVVRDEDGYHVFVVVERDGQTFAEARPVELGAASGDRVVIRRGLEPGDRLITVGALLVDDGSAIRVVPPARGAGRGG